MKNIGIVRRLDELGRIVIPREFRKTHRINVGDPLEITATENGSIVISKVDTVSDLTQLCETVCGSLNAELNTTVIAASFERFIAGSGQGRQAFLDKELPPSLSKMLKNRQVYNGSASGDEIGKLPEHSFAYVCIAPILSLDDCFGGFICLSASPIGNLDAAAVRLAGRLVGDTLQKY